jgi:hypothetical protein
MAAVVMIFVEKNKTGIYKAPAQKSTELSICHLLIG